MAKPEIDLARYRHCADPWTEAMRAGDFAAAWRISDAVLEARRLSGETCWDWPRHLQFVWTGRPFDGQRVLIRCYHGLGDTIQFVRFAAPLRARAREVIVWAQPELVGLIATARGVDRVLPLHEGAADAAYDVDIEVMELAHALRVAPEASARDIPYLFTNARDLPAAPDRSRLRVGLVWEAGPWDPRRSLPDSLVARLAATNGVRFYSLQRGPARKRARRLTLTDASCEDLTATAGRMLNLDLLISVDTMAAHLAGALGIPVWVLLHADSDWRWMAARSDSPWYPTMRLFRQPQGGCWLPVIEAVCEALRNWVAARQAS